MDEEQQGIIDESKLPEPDIDYDILEEELEDDKEMESDLID